METPALLACIFCVILNTILAALYVVRGYRLELAMQKWREQCQKTEGKPIIARRER